MAHGPNPACHLFLSIQCHWCKAILIYPHTASSCYCTRITGGEELRQGLYGQHSLNYLLSSLFQNTLLTAAPEKSFKCRLWNPASDLQIQHSWGQNSTILSHFPEGFKAGKTGGQGVQNWSFQDPPYQYITTLFGHKIILLTDLICSCWSYKSPFLPN